MPFSVSRSTWEGPAGIPRYLAGGAQGTQPENNAPGCPEIDDRSALRPSGPPGSDWRQTDAQGRSEAGRH
jgi:hypothetical protein